jgi:MerR family mercuric resistance operon transcriptional regulator
MFGIGALSRATGCPIDTIRYYEKMGLLEKPFRSEGGHRLYNFTYQKRLSFILKTRNLGFSLEKTRELLSLAENTERSCADALTLVNSNLCEVNEKIIELQRIQQALGQMAKDCQCCCPGARAPECTIVDALSNPKISSE